MSEVGVAEEADDEIGAARIREEAIAVVDNFGERACHVEDINDFEIAAAPAEGLDFRLTAAILLNHEDALHVGSWVYNVKEDPARVACLTVGCPR